MDQVPELVIAFIVSALLTLFDLDRTFYIPSTTQRKLILYGWWWGFIFANGLLAAGLEGIFGNANSLKSIDPLLRAALIGTAYLAFIRLKLTTFSVQGQEVSFWGGGFLPGSKELCL